MTPTVSPCVALGIFSMLVDIARGDIMKLPTPDTDPMAAGPADTVYHQKRVDVDSIIIQRRNFAVTTYHLIDDSQGHPIFTRPLKDRGKKFIFFNNPSFPKGSGHYIILRRMEGQPKDGGSAAAAKRHPTNDFLKMPQIYYESFSLSFKDSLTGSVTDLDPNQYNSVKTLSKKRLILKDPIQRMLNQRIVRKRVHSPYIQSIPLKQF